MKEKILKMKTNVKNHSKPTSKEATPRKKNTLESLKLNEINFKPHEIKLAEFLGIY